MDFDLEQNMRFKDSVGKYVKVKTVNSREHEGWLKCIDPMTGNLILVTLRDNLSVNEIILIFGHSCSNLEELKEGDEEIKNILKELYRADTLHHEDVAERKKRLVSWIKANRLPVTEKEDESVVVLDTVTISPPYDIQNCSGSNGVVLKNIRHLVAKLPMNTDEGRKCDEDKVNEEDE